MAGRVQWEAQVDSNIKQLLGEAKQLRDELDGIKKGNYEIKLNIDEKKLDSVISNLDKMLTSLGKGTGDFKEFETLSQQLKDIVSEVQTLNRAFGNINDSGVNELLSSIKNIDKSLSSLSEHIVGVNKDFSGIGKNASDNVGQINEAKKATEGLTEATRELANAQKNTGNKSNISSPIKDVFQGDEEKSIDTLKAKIKEIFTDTDELKRVLKSLDDGSYFWLDWFKDSDFTDADKKIEKLIPLLKEYGYTIKDLNSSSDAFETSGHIVSLADENGKLEKITTSAKDAATSKEKFANANKEVRESADETVISVNKEIGALEKAGSRFESQAAGLAIKPDDQHQFSSWKNDLNELNAKIQEYNSKVKYLKDNNIVDGEQVKEVKEIRDEIEKTIKAMTKTPQTKRGWTDIGASKAAEKVANVLKQNTKMSKEARDAIRAYYDELRSGNPSQPIDEILVKVNKLVQKERELGRVGKSFGEIFKEKVIYGGAAQLAGMVGFYDVINVIRQAGEAVIDLNTNITELAKVSEASASQIYDDFNSYADIAKEVGGTISDTISATADWSRNGYNIPDAKELAEVAMIYKNVGDGIDIDQANEYLISTLRGFSLEAKDAMNIIDSINEVANNEPISSAGIGEALQRSAAAFNVANTSLQESIALVTSTNSVLQSPEKVGSMWTTVSARIRGAKAELEDAGLETDGMVESTSKLQAMIKGMSGFDILEDDQKTFKSIYDIIIGIGEEFQNLSGVDQAALLEALAGKRQSNALAATLNNIDLLKKAYGEATNAEGSAMAEQEKYQQSIQYSIDRTKASLEELANDFISSDFLKGLIDFGDKLINILDLLIDKFGVLGTTAIIGGGILGGKNLGKTYEYTVFKLNCFEYALYA